MSEKELDSLGTPTSQSLIPDKEASTINEDPKCYIATTQQVQQPLSRAKGSTSVCWLTVAIVSAIFCCPPFGIVGAITAFLSKEAADQGDAVGHKRRLCQAKGFTLAAIAFGIITGAIAAAAVVYAMGIGNAEAPRGWRYDGIQRWDEKGIYMGCYKDDIDNRDLEGLYIDFGAENSVSKCVKHCADHGYKYAGLQEETQCYCDNSFGKYRKLGDFRCSSSCSGDGSKCGGRTINAIYKTNYLGCFNDDVKRSLGEHYYKMNSSEATPETCVALCTQKGFEFAGLQDSAECYCGNDPNRYGEADSNDCSAACLGDSDLLCGGNSVNSVFKTNYYLDATDQNYLGCYEDKTSDRDLDGFYVDLGSDNSIIECMESCVVRGYKYAGVQDGTKCFCSQYFGRFSKRKDSECDINCPGSWKKCGGLERNSVYRTFYCGCFEAGGLKALNESVYLIAGKVTPTRCISKCEDKGYLFAGVQNGKKCYCGHDMNRYREAPAHECKTRCGGDDEMVCGGNERNSVYRIIYL